MSTLHCPNTNSSEFKELEEIFGTAMAFQLWDLNKGKPLDVNDNGGTSLLYKSLKKDGFSRREIITFIGTSYMKSFRDVVGDWVENPQKNKHLLNEEGQPLKDIILGSPLYKDGNVATPILKETEPIKWFKEKFPEIPITKVVGLVNGLGYGIFTKNIEVLISDAAPDSVAYHEAFHVVSQLFMNENERQALYNEVKKLTGKELTDLQAEEHLADEFEIYMVSPENYKFSGEIKKNIFQRILNFIKEFFGIGEAKAKTNIREVFEGIRGGKFEMKDIKGVPIRDMYKLPELSPDQSTVLLDHMNILFFNELFEGGIVNSSAESFFKKLQNSEKVYETIKDKFKEGDYIYNNFEEIVAQHKRHLLQYQIVTDFELTEEERVKDSVANTESNLTDTKDTMPSEVKLAIASLPALTKSGQAFKRQGLEQTVDYNNIISILYNNLHDMVTMEDMFSRMELLSEEHPEIKLLLRRLGNGKSMDRYQGRLAAMFFTHFAKNRNTPLIFNIDEEGNHYFLNAVSDTQSRSVISQWKNNATRTASEMSDGVYSRNEKGEIIVNGDGKIYGSVFNEQGGYITYKEARANKNRLTTKQKLIVLDNLGMDIQIPYEDFDNTDVISNAFDWIVSNIKPGQKAIDVFTENGSKINKEIKELAEVATQHLIDNYGFDYINQDGKREYSITLNSHLSNTVHKLNSGQIPEYLKPYNPKTGEGNIFTNNSSWIPKIEEGKKLELRLLRGAQSKNNSDELTSLKHPDYMAITFNAVLEGIYPFLRAAGRKLEYGFTFTDHEGNIEKPDYEVSEEDTIEMLKDKLADEIATVLARRSGVGENLKYYSENSKDLGFFKRILGDLDILSGVKPSANLKDFHKKALDIISQNKDDIEDLLSSYLQEEKSELLEYLDENNIIDLTVNEGGAIPRGISNENIKRIFPEVKSNKSTLDFSQTNKLADVFLHHYLESNIEQTKLFIGDVRMFKSIIDLHKRSTGAASTKERVATDDIVNDWLNEFYTRADGKVYDGNFNSIVNEEVEVKSPYYEAIIEEMDAQGRVTMDFYREFVARHGKWSDEKERTYQYEMQKYFIENNLDKDEFIALFGQHTDNSMPKVPMYEGEKIEVSTLEALPPLKPQGFGPILNVDNLFAPSFDKNSIAPIVPSSLRKDSPLYQWIPKLMESQIDLIVPPSGSKITSIQKNGKHHPLYKKDGTFSDIDGDFIQVQSLDNFSEQQNIDSKIKTQTTLSTQKERLETVDFFDNGKTTNEQIAKLERRKERVKTALIKNRRTAILTELGIKETESGYELIDGNHSKFKASIIRMFSQRQMPLSVVDGLNLAIQGDTPIFDTLAHKNQIEQVLAALINKETVKLKVSGGMYIQEASTGHESVSTGRTFNKEGILTRNYLKFYEKDENGVSAMEVEMPLPRNWNNWVISEFGSLEAFNEAIEEGTVDERLLQFPANRIPAQQMSSLDVVKVKRFLPTHSGQKIILPTEIVEKTDSDYDVDKLTVYFPNVVFLKGKPRFVEYVEGNKASDIRKRAENIFRSPKDMRRLLGEKSELYLEYIRQESKAISDMFEEKSSFKNTEEFKELSDKINSLRTQRNLLSKYSENSDKVAIITAEISSLIEELTESLGSAKIQERIESRDKYIEDVLGGIYNAIKGLPIEEQQSIAALENEMIQIANETLLSPDNYDRLLASVGAENLKKFSQKSDPEKGQYGTRPGEEIKDYTSLMSYKYNMEVAKNNWAGLMGVGQTALQIVSHASTQKTPIRVSEDLVRIFFKGQKEEGGGYYIGHSKDEIGNYISGNFGQLMTGYVDIEKDPFIFYLNATRSVFPAYAFLLRTSNSSPVSMERLVAFFTSKPVTDFIKLEAANNSIIGGMSTSTVDNAIAVLARNGIQGIEKEMLASENIKNYFLTGRLADREIAESILESYSYLTEDQINNLRKKTDAGKKLNKKDKLLFIQIMDNFLMYKEFGRHLSDVVSITRPDSGLGKNRVSSKIAEKKKELVLEKSIFNSNDIETMLDSTHLREFEKSSFKFPDMFAEFFLTEQEGYKEVVSDMIDNYIHPNMNISDAQIASDRVENFLVSYILHNGVYTRNGEQVRISDRYKELIGTGEKSVVSKLASLMPRLSKFNLEDNLFLSMVDPAINEHIESKGYSRGIDFIRLFDRKFSITESDAFTASIEELFEHPNKAINNLAYDIMELSIMQNAMMNSPFSFQKFLPPKYYQPMAKEIISSIQPGEHFVDNYMARFFQNHANDKRVVPVLYPGKGGVFKLRSDKKDENFEYLSVPESKARFRTVFSVLVPAGKRNGNTIKTRALYVRVGEEGLSKSGETIVSYRRLPLKGDQYRFIEADNNINSMLPQNAIDFKVTQLKKAPNIPKESPMDDSGYLDSLEKDSGYTTMADMLQKAQEDKMRDSEDNDMSSIVLDEKVETNEDLDISVRNYLKAIGVQVNEVEEILDKKGKKLSAFGVARLADNMIDILQGKEGLQALPEEAAHFFVNMLPNNSNLKIAMFRDIQKFSIYNEVYENYKDVYTKEDGSPDIALIKEEAIGRLIARHMSAISRGEEYIEDLSEEHKRKLDTWWKKLWSMVKDFFLKSINEPFAKSAKNILDTNLEEVETQEEVEVSDGNLKTLVRNSIFDRLKNIMSAGLSKTRDMSAETVYATQNLGQQLKESGKVLNKFTKNSLKKGENVTNEEVRLVKETMQNLVKVVPQIGLFVTPIPFATTTLSTLKASGKIPLLNKLFGYSFEALQDLKQPNKELYSTSKDFRKWEKEHVRKQRLKQVKEQKQKIREQAKITNNIELSKRNDEFESLEESKQIILRNFDTYFSDPQYTSLSQEERESFVNGMTEGEIETYC